MIKSKVAASLPPWLGNVWGPEGRQRSRFGAQNVTNPGLVGSRPVPLAAPQAIPDHCRQGYPVPLPMVSQGFRTAPPRAQRVCGIRRGTKADIGVHAGTDRGTLAIRSRVLHQTVLGGHILEIVNLCGPSRLHSPGKLSEKVGGAMPFYGSHGTNGAGAARAAVSGGAVMSASSSCTRAARPGLRRC